MRVSYGEGLASHTGPESCGAVRKGVVEALTGVRAGWVLSHEKFLIRSADDFRPSEGDTGRLAIARVGWAPRGPRPHARTQAPHKEGFPFRSEAGRSRDRPVLRHGSAP